VTQLWREDWLLLLLLMTVKWRSRARTETNWIQIKKWECTLFCYYLQWEEKRREAAKTKSKNQTEETESDHNIYIYYHQHANTVGLISENTWSPEARRNNRGHVLHDVMSNQEV